MARKRYYFPYVAKNNPIFHLAVTSKTLIERVHEVTGVFKKYSENSDPKSPKHILYLMLQQNASLLQLSEFASAPKSDSTPPKVESSLESSSPGTSSSSISSLNQKPSSFGDSAQLDKDRPISDATDLASTSKIQPQEFSLGSSSLAVAAKKSRSPARKSQKDINPACIQEHENQDDKAEMAQKPDDSGSSAEEFKMPVPPVKDEKEVSKPAKRPRLFDKSLDKIPEFVSPVKKARTLMPSDEDDKMDISPNKSDKNSDSPSKDGNVSAASSDKIESPQKIEHFFSLAPILKDDGIELDISSRSEEIPGPSCAVSSAEMENLPDDASRVEAIRKDVEDRLKLDVSPNKTERDVSPIKKKSSNRSPRKSRTNSPGKDVPSTSRENPEVKSSSILSHPNVMTYLKLRFKSLLSHRNKYMRDIYEFFQQFNGDLRFLYFYSTNVSLAVKDIPTEGKAYFTTEARNLKTNLIRNANELSSNLRSMLRTVESDIPFWRVCLREIRILNEEHENFLTVESDSQTTVEYLRQYEMKLRIVWNRMDRRILLGDGLRSSLLTNSANFMKLTRDFSRYLIIVEIMKPSSLTSSEGEKRKLNISWR